MKDPKEKKPKRSRKIGFRYNGRDQTIRYDGHQFIPHLINPENQFGFIDGGYFVKLGNAIKAIINHEISEEPEEAITLKMFIERYEQASKEITSIEEDDLEF